MRASVPLRATVFCRVRSCTREKTTTSPDDDALLEPLVTVQTMPPATSTTATTMATTRAMAGERLWSKKTLTLP